MLCLTRNTSDEIFINETIRLVVLGIENGKVRLGFEAPKEVPIRRGEIPASRFQAPAKSHSEARALPPALPQQEGKQAIHFGFVFQT